MGYDMKIAHRPMHGVSVILALAVLLVVMSVLSGCVQPYPAESKSMGTQPICVFLCFATVSAVEDNAGSPTTTVGSSATGGGRSRSTVVEDYSTGDAPGRSELY